MKHQILEYLQAQGPKTVQQIASDLHLDLDEATVAVIQMVFDKQVYQEVADGTIWFVQEYAA